MCWTAIVRHLNISLSSRTPDVDVDSSADTEGPSVIPITSLERFQKLKYLDLDDEAIFGMSATDCRHVRAPVRHSASHLGALLPLNVEYLVLREARQYDPLPDRRYHWIQDCYAFGQLLQSHSALRRLDTIGYESKIFHPC
ncbi:hypothetical protein DOTSEDRAFT_37305 [Dothistroma septosporum NZE10]|uniref:Uncharacterized protein n=1 Tax=Dothistroma septosporum (strain NZE10 / CBS 128990) TaxID=675120 RepID=N1PDM9_DOTSN|nr:hypothetical protein DOTSEDRAFT_37305 [Dothistroma septosporum NZE10]